MFRSRQLRFMLGLGLATALLITLLVILFNQGTSSVKTPTPKPMAAYANNPTASVTMLIDGPVNASSLHNQVQISVSNSNTVLKIYTGYNSKVTASYAYPMSEAAFHVFLRSLEFAGYNYGSPRTDLSQASGFCPTGDRYIFSFNADNKQLQRFWTTSCNGAHTYNGNLDLTVQLFEAQVPNYIDLTSDLNI